MHLDGLVLLLRKTLLNILSSDTVVYMQRLVLCAGDTFGASIVKVERGDNLGVVLEDLADLQGPQQGGRQHHGCWLLGYRMG